MGKVYRTPLGRGRTPEGLSAATLAKLNKQMRYSYLVESPNYELEAVLSSFLERVEPRDEHNKSKAIVVAPPLGPYDFSSGELVSFTHELDGPVDHIIQNLRAQLNAGTWTLPRVLWEIALNEFVAPLDTNSPELEVDDVRFGDFWLNGQEDFRERLYERRLSSGFKFIGNFGFNPTVIEHEDSAKRIFGSMDMTWLAFHRVIPEPIAELTRAQVAEAIQIRSYADVSKRATRDKIIREAVAELKPGYYRKNRLQFIEEAAARGGFIAFSHHDDGSYTIIK